MDKQIYEKNERGHFLHIEARSAASLLIKNEARPKTYYNIGIRGIFDLYIDRYKNFVNKIPSRLRAHEVTIGKGLSEWEAFCHACLVITDRKPYMRRDKYIVFGYFDTDYRIKENVLSSKSIYNPSEIISHVIMRDDDGEYTKIYKNRNRQSRHIYKKRFYIAPKQWEDEKSISAKDLFDKSLENVYLKEIVIDGFYDYDVGDTVIFEDERYAIKEVTAEFSEGKIQTKITCCYDYEFNV